MSKNTRSAVRSSVDWLLGDVERNLDQSEDESTSGEIDDDSSIPDTTETIDEDYRPPSCSRPSSVTLGISTNSMAKQTAQVALSRGLSVRDHVSMQASFVKSGGGNVNDFVMSVSTTWRHKQQNLKKVYEKIREEGIKPKFSVIHFDSKLIKYLSGLVDDRLAVLICGYPLNTPKLLGIPSIPDSTGDSQNNAVWKGSVSLIERRLDRSVMWLACRHHVYELHIKHVAETVLGKRNSPSEGLFRRFKKEWDQLDQDVNGLTLFDYTGISSDCRKQAEHAFLRCRLSSISPAQDLLYLRLMQYNREEDRDVADAAIKSFLNHLWYVTQEVVVFFLFDSVLPAD
ncbi:Cc8K15.2-like protein [Daphnia magna]|uniref:Cc8K15.2-like protein n=1 Tax=Daphnia magna TaxID=35525 RepID=A0A164T7Q8_9CRUS|nr:Cc8K15.2-like protein [Daphnia magna]